MKPAATIAKRKGARLRGPDPARVRQIVQRLERAYPTAQCALKHSNPFQLLVATILSAQCTDERVNKVTPGLFQKYPTPRDFAALRQEVLEQEIRSTGFFRNKSKSILGAARRIVSDFGKAAGVVVDTHVRRIARRLDLSRENTPEKIEQDLMRLLPQDHWIAFSHQMIFHGRLCCTARKPKCAACPLEDLCDSEDKTG